MAFIEVTDPISLVKSIILIICAILVILGGIGILRYKDDLERVMYAESTSWE